MIRLRQKDIERLAIITDGSVDYLTKLVSMSLIDHSYAVDQLIKYSYKKLKSEKRYTPAQMIEALMREYGASKLTLYAFTLGDLYVEILLEVVALCNFTLRLLRSIRNLWWMYFFGCPTFSKWFINASIELVFWKQYGHSYGWTATFLDLVLS